MVAFFLLLSLFTSCASRYRLDFYLISGGESKKINVEQTQFANLTVLGSPLADNKIVQGMGNTIVIGTGARGEREAKVSQYDVLGFDEYLHCQIYVQLPLELKPGSYALQGNSFVQILGRYDQSPELNIFSPESGSFVVDSVASKRLFGGIKMGTYSNPKGAKLTFNGNFKVKVAE